MIIFLKDCGKILSYSNLHFLDSECCFDPPAPCRMHCCSSSNSSQSYYTIPQNRRQSFCRASPFKLSLPHLLSPSGLICCCFTLTGIFFENSHLPLPIPRPPRVKSIMYYVHFAWDYEKWFICSETYGQWIFLKQ
jgi:hypothetical protein